MELELAVANMEPEREENQRQKSLLSRRIIELCNSIEDLDERIEMLKN